jgi:MOSC domain-containing protein YiiM
VKSSFSIISINTSSKVGEQKKPVHSAELRVNHGIVGDAHARDWHRQVSLLADEDVDTMRGLKPDFPLSPGDFAENITTRGIPLDELPVGSRVYIDETELEITQKGKECHHGCAIYQAVGDCVMPRKGVFAKVIKGGMISSESSCYYCL